MLIASLENFRSLDVDRPFDAVKYSSNNSHTKTMEFDWSQWISRPNRYIFPPKELLPEFSVTESDGKYFFFFLQFFQFFYRPSSALISWSSTQVLLNNWCTFCAGSFPMSNFHFSLHGCSGVGIPDLLITRPKFYHQTMLLP